MEELLATWDFRWSQYAPPRLLCVREKRSVKLLAAGWRLEDPASVQFAFSSPSRICNVWGNNNITHQSRAMNTWMRSAVCKSSVPVVAMLLLAATTSRAMEASGSVLAEPPLEELVELKEVRVRGKKLVRRITKSEDRLFKAYNIVNTNDDYDVHCGDMSLEPGSMIMVRTCLPGFLSNLDRRAVYFPTPVPETQGSQAYGSSCAPALGAGIVYGCGFSVPQPTSRNPAMPSVSWESEYGNVPVSVLRAYHRQAYAENVLYHITEDEQLLAMANELVGLYQEMQLVQGRFARLREEQALRAKASTARGGFPRNLRASPR